jgi:colanic acid/amylovoran biosynthesis glycosyltransferase
MTTAIFHYHPTWLKVTENWIYNQIRNLPADYETHILCEKTENLSTFAMPNMHVLGTRRHWRFWYDKLPRKLGLRTKSPFFLKASREVRPALVHSHFGHVGWEIYPSVSQTGASHVVTFYGQDLTRLPAQKAIWRKRYAQLFAHVDRVVCEGPFMRQSLLHLGCPTEKALVHHLGISIEKIPFQPRAWAPGTPLRVLLAGRFAEKKGFPDALAALAKLRRDVDLRVTIVGDAGDSPDEQQQKAKILDIIEQSGLAVATSLLGFQPHSTLLNLAYENHIFLSPSVVACDGDSEGGAPVTLIEMAATGMPVVSTKHCDIPSVIQDERTGLLADERDIDGLVARLGWLVDNPGRWAEMVAAGRAHIEAEYDSRRQGEMLGAIYASVLS